MAESTRIPPAKLTGLYGAIVKRMSCKMFGEVPDSLGVVWHNRKALNLSFSLGRKMKKLDKCDENLKSFAHMATASLIGCSACLDIGYFFANNEGLDVTKAPIAFIIHGAHRSVEGVRDDWERHADKYGFMVIAPLFDKEQWNHFETAGMFSRSGKLGDK